jgi:hypothetical protein
MGTPEQNLAKRLRALMDEYEGDEEKLHLKMDEELLRFINDPAVTDCYNDAEIWYG